LKSNTKTKILILGLLELFFIFPILINFNFLSESQYEEILIDNELNVSSSVGLILRNNYVYDYPYTQSEWWGNADAVMNPSNQSVDGFFVSRSAGGYYSDQKIGLLIRFDVNCNVEWLKTTENSLYPAAMVAALPNEKSVMGAYHYNYDYIDYFSFDKDGASIYTWTNDPSENEKQRAMKGSNGLWAVGDIETPTKGVFIRKVDYTNGSVLASNIWNLGLDTNVVGISSDNNGGLYITGWILNNSKHQLFIAHANSTGNIVSSNIIYDDQLNIRGVACIFNGTKIYVVGIYQNGVGQDKYNSYIWTFNSSCNLQESVLLTSEAKYGIGYYAKGDDTSWIYFNYDIKILNSNTSELVITDVIEKDYANIMVHLLDSSLNEIDYYEYKTDTTSNRYHDSCGKLVITEYGRLFSVMFSSLVYSDHPYIRIVEYLKGNYENPIFIDGSATGVGAHNWSWAVAQDWCDGSGVFFDPYVIEDLVIDGRGSGSTIFIQNSNKHFTIENCTLSNTGEDWWDAGIYLYNVDNGQLNNNSIHNANNGLLFHYSDLNVISGNNINNIQQDAISIWYSYLNTIVENNVVNNDYGISLHYSEFNNISGNEVNNQVYQGVVLRDSNNNYIIGNDLYNDGYHGILLYNSHDNTISGNTASFNSHGIHLTISDSNVIIENTLINNSIGIYLYDSHHNEVSNNIFSDNDENIKEIINVVYPVPIGIITLAVILIIFTMVISGIIFYKKRRSRRFEIPYKREEIYTTYSPQLKIKEIEPKLSTPKDITGKPVKNCPHCGQKLYLEAIFCFKCGKKVEEDQVIPSVSHKKEDPLVSEIPQIKPKVIPYFCEFCGTALNKKAIFCPQCGTIKKKQ